MNDLLKVMKLDNSRGHILFQNTPAMLFPLEYPASETKGKANGGRTPKGKEGDTNIPQKQGDS